MKLSRVVHLVRLVNGISLDKLAARMSVTKGYIGMIENGKKSPGLNFLLDLSQATGLPFTYIGMLMDLERLEKEEPELLDAAIKSHAIFGRILARKQLEDSGLIESQKRITNIQNVVIPALGKVYG